jgi:ketosteroid isomerase-like protein
MTNEREAQVRQAEERLRVAMLHSDVKALDELLSPDLIFTMHTGQVVGKQDDLATHESGVLEFKEIACSDQRIRFHGDVAIVSVRVHISAAFGGMDAEGNYRFTRVWASSAAGAWQVIAGHASEIR